MRAQPSAMNQDPAYEPAEDRKIWNHLIIRLSQNPNPD